MSRRADYVIAKGDLASYCSENDKPDAQYENFHDVVGILSAWLAGPKQTAAKMPTPPIPIAS
jgi:hypothetical protein